MGLIATIERGGAVRLAGGLPSGPDSALVRVVGEELLVAVDRWGASPVWVAARDGGLLVGTTQRATALAASRRDVVPAAVVAVLAGLPRWEEPLLDGVERLTRCALHRLGTGGVRSDPAPPVAPPAGLGDALLAAVRRRTGERVVCALSGGLDSAGLLALATLAEGRAPRAFTLCDGGALDPELLRARLTAAHVGADLAEVVVLFRDLPAAFADAVRAADAVVWDGRGVSKFLFWKTIRADGAVAALSGVGADEVLLGAPSAMAAEQGRAAFDRAMDRERELGRSVLRSGSPVSAEVPRVRGRRDALRIAQDRVLPLSTLPVERAAAAASGVDVRLPFLDEGVAAWADAQPTRALARGVVGKRPLRRMLRGLVPEAVRSAKKEPRLLGVGAQPVDWLPALEPHLTFASLDRLVVVDPRRARALLDRAARGGSPEERATALRVLMKLCSLVILTE